MSENINITIDIPRKIIHDKSAEMKYTENGAAFAWLDLSSVVKLEDYGLWFPDWLIEKNHLEYYTLIIKRVYISKYTEKEVQNKFVIEHKEKIEGKRYKRFTYSPEELVDLLNFFSDRVNKVKEAEKTKILAKVTERVIYKGNVTFYALGYINGKKFFSKDLPNWQVGKRISAKGFELIARNLTEAEIMEIRKLIEVNEIAENEFEEFERFMQKIRLPDPFRFRRIYPDTKKILSDWEKRSVSTNEKLIKLDIPFYLACPRLTIKGYPEKIESMIEAINAVRSFLKDTVEQTEIELNQYNLNRNGGNKHDNFSVTNNRTAEQIE